MPRDDSPPHRNPEEKRSSGGGQTRGERDGSPAARRGRSGYGMESIRPHLRAQLAERKLLRPTFPPEDPDEVNRSNTADG